MAHKENMGEVEMKAFISFWELWGQERKGPCF